MLLFAAASEEGKDGKVKAKRSSSAAAKGGKKPTAAGRKKKAAEPEPEAVADGDGDGDAALGVLEDEEGLLEGEGEEDEGVEYEFDEEALPEEMRALLQRPSRGLAELLQEAGIEFGDPSLMDDVVEGQGPKGFRAGVWVGRMIDID